MKYTRYLDHLEDRDAALHPSSTQTTPDWCPACLPGGKLRPITMDMNGAPNLIHPWQQARRSTPLPIPQIGKLPQSLPEKGILCSASGCDGLGRVVWVEITPFRAVRKRHTTPLRGIVSLPWDRSTAPRALRPVISRMARCASGFVARVRSCSDGVDLSPSHRPPLIPIPAATEEKV